MVTISTRLRRAIAEARLAGTRQYAIARLAGVHPTVASALLNNAIPTREDDVRVVRLGAAVGLAPTDCFEHVGTEDVARAGSANNTRSRRVRA